MHAGTDAPFRTLERRTRQLRSVLFAAALATSPARAADGNRAPSVERLRPWQVAAGVAGSAVPGALGKPGREGLGLFGGAFFSAAAAGGAVRPFVGAGLDLSIDAATQNARRGERIVERSVPAWTLGPQLRAGLGFGRPDELTSAYLAFTPFYANTTRAAAFATESGGTWGLRSMVGVSLLDSWPLLPAALPHRGSCDGGLCTVSVLLLLLPTTLELGWERLRDENRAAVFIGYTL